MPLTPADVHNVAFKKPPIGKRGYDEEEVDAFLDEVERELARLIEENNELRAQVENRFARATMADVVAHIDHVVKIAGIDAVGIGSDFDGIDCTPLGLDDVGKFPALTRALLEKGYSAEQIGKIYSGNTLRLMREVERVARASKASPAQ